MGYRRASGCIRRGRTFGGGQPRVECEGSNECFCERVVRERYRESVNGLSDPAP